jgi:hypothetical protein
LFGLTTLGLYFFIDRWHGKALGQLSGVTAFTFVLLLLLNTNWVLSLVAFFLDRFRQITRGELYVHDDYLCISALI